MSTIRSLFDPSKDIYRAIEKVISYGVSQQDQLKAEISEYVVTDNIEDQFFKLLESMQLAMEGGGGNEVGVWVSGFYGSGKSSFTKYLGLALDEQCIVDGVPFIEHLQDRLHRPQTKALLATVAKRFPAAVVMLDLASEMLAGATMADVSSVLYYKVLQWAGYSRNLKVAALERKLQQDGRFDEFLTKVENALPGMLWSDLQDDPLVVDGLIPKIAHQMYPQLFPQTSSFSSRTEDFVQFEDQRVQEMLNIVFEKSGKKNIVFIVDEVGQYVGSSNNLILNLDGLAKNLKRLGSGKAWIIATAQQTLTEDDPRASLNSPELYKLKDRFPIQIDLESSDIKEICYRRLLGKSPAGQAQLGKLFAAHGQALRHNTKLHDAKAYEADFGQEEFTNLYPFLPAHFDILLHLLGALAKSTGGVGLRSAIKVIQDVLRGEGGSRAMADQPLGWLVNTATLYDELEKDIRRTAVYPATNKLLQQYGASEPHASVIKSVAIMQIIQNLPVTRANVAALIHPTVDSQSQLEAVKHAVDELLADKYAPFGEEDGELVLLSEKLRNIEEERGNIALRSVDIKRICNEALRECFSPLPRISLQGGMAVATGLKVRQGNTVASLSGEKNIIQTEVQWAATDGYDVARNAMVTESRSNSSRNTIGLLARTQSEIQDLAAEIYRCRRIAELHRNEPDQEIQDYCNAQLDRAARLAAQLQAKTRQALQGGSFVFRGSVTAVSALSQDLADAAKKLLTNAAQQVFDRYMEAPVRVDTNAAEKFLKTANPAAITSDLDPLDLVQAVSGGQPSFNTQHKAIVSIQDAIDKNGTMLGGRLLDYFGSAPFGWQKDTTRYIVAAMLMAGEIKLKVSGREVTAPGQQAVDALKTNNAFKNIGVSLRDERPSMEMCARASTRLTELVGEPVLALEPNICKAASKHFPRLQHEYGALAERLERLGLAGSERVNSLTQELADAMATDASDAPQRLGGETSALYDNLKWAFDAKQKLDGGLAQTVEELQAHNQEIQALPNTGVPGELRAEVAEQLQDIAARLQSEDFYQHAADLSSQLTNLKASVRDAATRMAEQQKQSLEHGVQSLQRLPEWQELTQEERGNTLAELDDVIVQTSQDLQGLKALLRGAFEFRATLDELTQSIQRQGQERIRQRAQQAQAALGVKDQPSTLAKTIQLPATVTSAADLDSLLRQLNDIKAQVDYYAQLEVRFAVSQVQQAEEGA